MEFWVRFHISPLVDEVQTLILEMHWQGGSTVDFSQGLFKPTSLTPFPILLTLKH